MIIMFPTKRKQKIDSTIHQETKESHHRPNHIKILLAEDLLYIQSLHLLTISKTALPTGSSLDFGYVTN